MGGCASVLTVASNFREGSSINNPYNNNQRTSIQSFNSDNSTSRFMIEKRLNKVASCDSIHQLSQGNGVHVTSSQSKEFTHGEKGFIVPIISVNNDFTCILDMAPWRGDDEPSSRCASSSSSISNGVDDDQLSNISKGSVPFIIINETCTNDDSLKSPKMNKQFLTPPSRYS